MPHIAILSASVRTGRNSHRVALFFKRFIEEKNLATVEIIDLNEYQFPIFNERIMYRKAPDAFAWIGLYSSFEKAGFRIVDHTSKNRPTVRYYLSEG